MRRSLLLGTALGAVVVAAPASLRADPAVNARPEGGKVSAGSATIARSSSATTITQSTSRAVIDWTGFDVGRQQSVTFVQPSGSATTLNRVNAAEPSQIAGRITANGRIIIENRAGIVVADGAQIDANAVVLSAAGTTNRAFMAGSGRFNVPAKAGATVSNRGTITVRQAGLAALVAPNVSNDGVIEAKGGEVVLAGASTFKVDLYGDGLLSFETAAPGAPTTVRNSGSISAPGGRVLLTAAQADGIVTSLVEAGGRISADTTAGGKGSIRIQSTGGSITIDGALTAAGRSAKQQGGSITVVTPGTVTVAAGSTIDASGSTGGGKIVLGTAGGVTAAATKIAAGAVLRADATDKGRGGQVKILSAQSTTMDGRISAEGGPRGGHGGTIEVSGHLGFAMSGSASVAAPTGAAGTILLDPQDLTIRSGGADGGLFQTTGTDGTLSAGSNGGSPFAIAAAIDPVVFAGLTGNVVLQAARDLTVQSAITSSAASLSLQAGRNLTVNAPITLSGAGTLSIAAAVSAFAGQPGYDAGGPNGVLALSPIGSVTAPLAQVNLSSGAGGFLSSGPIIAGGLNINVASTGAFILGGSIQAGTLGVTAAQIALAGSVKATTVQLTTATGGAISASGSLAAQGLAVSAGSASFSGAAINVGTLTAAQTTGGFTLINTGDLLAIGTLTAGASVPLASNTAAFQLASAGTLSLGTSSLPAVLTAGTVALAGAFGVVQVNGGISANLLSGTVAGSAVTGSASVTLTGSNSVANFGSMSVIGPLALSTSGSLNVLGTVSAGGAMTLSAGGALTLGSLSQAASLSAATLRLSAGGAISEPNASITTGTLTASGSAITLPGANRIGMLAGASAGGDIAITDATALAVTAPLSAGGSVFINSGTGGLSIAAPISTGAGGTIALIGDALSWSNPSANPLNASATGTIALAPATAGRIFTLGTGSGLALGATTGLTASTLQIGAAPSATGAPVAVTAGSVAITGFDGGGLGVLALAASGAVTQTGPLTGAARIDVTAGSAVLGDAGNHVPVLGTVVTSGAFSLTSATDITLLGTLQAGIPPAPNSANTATALLQTMGSITLGNASTRGVVNAGTVVLLGGGTISEVNGSIAANILSGPQSGAAIQSATSVSLRGANTVTTLGGFATSGDLAFVNTAGLTLGGALTAGSVPAPNPANTATITIQAGGDLALGSGSLIAALSAGRIDLLASGAITEPRGIIQANTLNGPGQGAAITSAVSVSLTGTNAFSVLGSFVAAGSIRIADAASMVVGGIISAGNGAGNVAGNTALAELTAQGDLRIGQVGGPAVVNAGTVSLLASGTISEVSGGIVANQLIGPGPAAAINQATAADLHGTNIISQIGRFYTSGGFSLSDSSSVTLLGTLSAGSSATAAITTTGSLTIGQGSTLALISAGTVSLLAAGAVSENPASSINATLLTGPFPGFSIAAATDATLSGINTVGQISQFNVTGSLIFRNQRDLVVTGTLSAGTVPAPDARNASAIGLIVAGNLALGTTAAPAVLNAGTVGLAVSGALSEPAGSIVTGLLNDLRLPGAPASASSIQLGGSNTIAAISELGARGNISIWDSVPLAVYGTITAGGVQAPSLANTGTVSLGLAGSLTLGDATRTGAINAGTAILMPTGAISEPNGAVTVNQLVLPSSGQSVAQAPAIDLSGRNAISVLGAVNANGDVFVNSTVAMTVAGGISLGTQAAPNAANTTTLTLASAGDLAIAANLMAGTVSLQSAGTLSQSSGVIMANRLSGPAVGLTQVAAAAVTLDAANTISELGAFTSNGTFLLTDALGFTVTGAVTAGGAAVPPAAGGATLRLSSGGAIAIGTASQPAVLTAGTVTLLTAAAITEDSASRIAASTLQGPNAAAAIAAAGSVSLVGANTIASLSSFTTTGDFALANAGSLVVSGTIAAGAASVFGVLNAAHLTIGLSSGALDLGTAGTAGVLNAGTIALAASGGINEPNGRISALLLSDQTGLTGVPQSASVSLPSLANTITALGTISTLAGSLVLNSSGAMTVIGPVNASQRLAVSATGVMTVLGNVAGGDGGVSLSGDLGIQQISGGVTASATGAAQLSLTSLFGSFAQFPGASITSATSAGITVQGSITLAANVLVPNGTLTLNSAGGGIAETVNGGTKGTVFVQTLAANAAGSITLDSSTNRVSNLSLINTGGQFTLATTSPLLIAGNVTSAAETSITGTKAIEQVSGSIVAGGTGVQILSRLGSFVQDASATMVATANGGTVSLSALAAGATIDISGTLSATGSDALVALNVPLGGILELPGVSTGGLASTGGRILATRISAVALDNIVMDPAGGGNAIASVESLISNNGTVSLLNTAALQVGGTVQAANGFMLQSTGDLTVATGASAVTAAGAGTLHAGGLLAINSGGTVTAGDLSLIAPVSTTIGGTVAAPRLFIGGAGSTPAGLVVLDDGASVQVGAAVLPATTAPLTSWPTYAGSAEGGYISAQNLVIGRGATIRGANGSASQTMRIDITGTGVFDQSAGLQADTTTLLLNLGSRTSLSGNVSVGGLYIAYPRGTRGSVALSGTVRGVGGQAAAQIAAITPGPNALYQINACPIASVACFVVSTERLPQTVPIRDLDIRPAHDTVDEAEILLPNVSREDF